VAMVAIPYNLLERLRLLVTKNNGKILGEEYAADITVTLQFPVETFDTFEADLRELSAGKIKVEVIESKEEIVKI
jgi:putative IMPACT (imprinted ancient) family translation regulator